MLKELNGPEDDNDDLADIRRMLRETAASMN